MIFLWWIQVKQVLTLIKNLAFPASQERLFAFSHSIVGTSRRDKQASNGERNKFRNGWELYNAEKEYERCLHLSSNLALRC